MPEITLDKAIDMLRAEYARATAAKYVEKPVSCALYRTWRKVDDVERERPQKV